MGMTTALRLAKGILNGFEAFFGDFENMTLGAQVRFEKANWKNVHLAMSERLTLYKHKVEEVSAIVKDVAGDTIIDHRLWQEAKAEYVVLVSSHKNYEIAQTFFNSVYCYIFGHEKIRDVHAFVVAPESVSKPPSEEEIVVHYNAEAGLEEMIGSILKDAAFNLPYEDFNRDVARICTLVRNDIVPRLGKVKSLKVDVLESLFYRNKGAYLVARISVGDKVLPFILPVLNNEKGGVFVDTVIYSEEGASIIFSFTRSYFMVETSVPSRYVAFLKSIMPDKEVFELYSALGFGKHAKTEFYRGAVKQTLQSDDQYELAPGIKGMVMLVFTRPDASYVYKVIKDKFTPPKNMTRDEVKKKYFLVKRWDRAGRMADTQEFSNLAFDRRRFSDELMDELYEEVPSLIEERGNALILKHCYVERKMEPLNLYLRDAGDEQVASVMDEYGNAIKQLASANIFPGDMLLKNFGVTRHGRVVFYDYDEIQPLTECNFRIIPEPQTPEQEMASQPWYEVGENDIFPEEFRLFFSGNKRAREAFDARHADLYEADFWQGLQDKIRSGVVTDMFPYRRRYRFPRPEAVES
jgi:isocitrate dehydrogenase kinase/phosphatase